MRVDIAWWDLDGTPQTIDSLREHLRDGTADAWRDVPGLRLKFWMADPEHNRWGAVMLWDTDRPADLPPNRAARLIGRPPAHRTRFDIEAAVEGVHVTPQLDGTGPVFTTAAATAVPKPGDREPCTST
ncbi:hypothetical protein [Streptomyces sp. NPDC001536]|uniref:hypothetical protein n=1 Tax=Streptomyces sp. NPDC001536 TaxID=3364583 RepID=UPI0036CD3439